MDTMNLPEGVRVLPLTPHEDTRGSFTEIFRASWPLVGPLPLQWNLVTSHQSVVRGVHVHLIHLDYWMLVSGRAAIGVRDLRRHSPTFGLSAVMDVNDRGTPRLIVIPPGVAHGFQFHEDSVHVYAVTAYWNEADELGCRWDDPALGIPWPSKAAFLSCRDTDAGTLENLMARLEPHQGALYAPRAGRV